MGDVPTHEKGFQQGLPMPGFRAPQGIALQAVPRALMDSVAFDNKAADSLRHRALTSPTCRLRPARPSCPHLLRLWMDAPYFAWHFDMGSPYGAWDLFMGQVKQVPSPLKQALNTTK